MKLQSILGIVLIVVGVIAMAYQGFTYTSSEKILDIGPLEVTAERTRSFPLPLAVGAVVFAGGVALLVFSRRGA